MASTPARTSPGAADSLATVHAASALIGRVVPGRAGEFRLALIPADSGRDVFEVAAAGDTVILRGSSGIALASALDWYLQHAAGINISTPLEPVMLPHPLPAVTQSVRAHHTVPRPLLLQLLHLLLQHGLVGLAAVGADDRLDGAQGHQPPARRHRTGSGLARRAHATSDFQRQADRRFPGGPGIPAVGLDGQHRRARRARCPRAGSTPTSHWNGRSSRASASWA